MILKKVYELFDNKIARCYHKIEQRSINGGAEMKSEETKERIILETIALIQEMNGDIEKVTIRKIAEKAQIGIGLINHYFESKDRLIDLCVQRIINQVVHSFKIKDVTEKTTTEITKIAANHVMDFLMSNIQIARVSIVGDLSNPQVGDNSMQTAKGFAYCMSGGTHLEAYMARAFYLMSIMQESFLRRDNLVSTIGVNLNIKSQREAYMNEVVDMVMGGRT